MHKTIARKWLLNRLGLVLGAALGLLSGCGSSGATFSCDNTSGGVHSCSDYNVSNGEISTYQAACTTQMGKSVTSCSRTGAVGACALTVSSGGVTITTTSWTYAGTAADLMTGCKSLGGTFVSP